MKITQNQHLTGNRPQAHNRDLNQPEETIMPEIDRESLDLKVKNYAKSRLPAEDREWKIFEKFCTELILRDEDIADEDISTGDIGSGGDGGADGFYFLVNGQAVVEDVDMPKDPSSAEIILIQATRRKTFEGDKVKKFKEFCEWCLDWERDLDTFPNINPKAKDAVQSFRDNYRTILGDVPNLQIKCHFAAMTTLPPDGNTSAMVGEIEKYIKTKATSANFSFTFWQCQDLLRVANAPKNEDLVLDTVKSFPTHDESVVCLARIDKFARFLTNEKNEIRLNLMEPNVRDYQGKKNPVNKGIRDTLDKKDATVDFWWLNNGITMLADDCAIFGDTVKVTRPQIVNGLQTSFEIFESFKEKKSEDSRCVLIRIIRTTNDLSKNKIIKATNYQTNVAAISLRATEPIQLDIEEIFNLYGLFYDRRKGQRRRERKDISKVVSMTTLGQVVASVLLQMPAEARGNPKKTLDAQYDKVFGSGYDRKLFVSCIMLDRAVVAYLSEKEPEDALKAYFRFYMDMAAACKILNTRTPNAETIAASIDLFKTPHEAFMEYCHAIVKLEYLKLGGVEKVAKSIDFSNAIKSKMDSEFEVIPSQQPAT